MTVGHRRKRNNAGEIVFDWEDSSEEIFQKMVTKYGNAQQKLNMTVPAKQRLKREEKSKGRDFSLRSGPRRTSPEKIHNTRRTKRSEKKTREKTQDNESEEDEDQYLLDISSLVGLQQADAAVVVGMCASTMSKRLKGERILLLLFCCC